MSTWRQCSVDMDRQGFVETAATIGGTTPGLATN